MKKTLGGCKSRPHAFDLVDDELWEQSDLALQDCEAGLSSLASFAVAIKANEKRRLWKVRVGIDMSIHARKLEQFRMSLRRSNCALQTVLHTITLSLTLQNNNSQTLVLTALDKLKSSIDDAMWMAARSSSRPQGNGAAFDSITSQNLQSLAKAAQTFHSTASSAAGSSVGSSANTEYMKMPKEAAGSVSGLNPIQAERLHDYIYNTSSDLDILDPPTDQDDSFRQNSELNLLRSDYYHASDTLPALSDLDLQLPLMEVLEDFALEKMKELDFTSAASYLEQACSNKLGGCPAPDIHLRLQTRLAICYLFQGNRTKCEAALKRIENFGGMLDLEALNILHAVAISYLTEWRFDEATDACQTALRAKLRLLGKSHPETLQTLGLLARIYDESDEVIHLEATRRLMPKGFIYVHPSNERDFLTARSSLIPRPDTETTCGLVELDNNEVFPVYELPAGDMEHISLRSGLQRTLTRYEKVQADARQEAAHPETLSLKDTSEEEFFFKPTKAPKRSLSHSMLSMVRRSSSLRRSLSYKKRSSAGIPSDEASKVSRTKTVLRRRQNSTKSPKEDAKADRLTRWKSIFGTWLIRRENATHPDDLQPTRDDHGPHELDPTPLGGSNLQTTCGVQTGYGLQEDITPGDCLCNSDTPPEQKEFRSALGFCLANHSARANGTTYPSNESFQEITMFQESLSRSSSGSKSSGSGAESVFDGPSRSSSSSSLHSPIESFWPKAPTIPPNHHAHSATYDECSTVQPSLAAGQRQEDTHQASTPTKYQCDPPIEHEHGTLDVTRHTHRSKSQAKRRKALSKDLRRTLSWNRGDDAVYQARSASAVALSVGA